MADDMMQKIRKALTRMTTEEVENLFWYMTLEGLI
jgi:hypothetical protein